MEVECSACRTTLDVEDDRLGQRIHCPGCGQTIVVADLPVAEFAESWEVEEEIPASSMHGAQADRTKTCPMCGATIKEAARRCRFCGEMLGGGGLDSRPSFGIWRDKDRLVMSKGAELPYICVKTNRPADGWLRRKLYWHHWGIYLLLLVTPLLVYVIVALIVRQKADIQVGLTRDQLRRRRWVIAGSWLGVLGGIVVMVVGIANTAPNSAWGVAMIIAGFATILAAAIIGLLLARIVHPARITKEYVWIKGVHPGYLASLPEFPAQ